MEALEKSVVRLIVNDATSTSSSLARQAIPEAETLVSRTDQLIVSSLGTLAREQIRPAVEKLSDEQIFAMALEPIRDGGPIGGTSFKLKVRDPISEQVFMFKPTLPGDSRPEIESFVLAMRRAAAEPAVQVLPQQVELAGKRVQGTVKPWIENAGLLSDHVQTWTPEQKAMVLSDHAWMEFVGNYDTHAAQYLRIGRSALNIDWDRALEYNPAMRPLTRFNSRYPAIACQDLLYEAYVRGQTDLDFTVLHDTIARIQRIPDEKVVQELSPFLEKTFGGDKTYGHFKSADEFVKAVLSQKATLGDRFTAFEASLKKQRAAYQAHPTLESLNVRDVWLAASNLISEDSPVGQAIDTFREFFAHRQFGGAHPGGQ